MVSNGSTILPCTQIFWSELGIVVRPSGIITVGEGMPHCECNKCLACKLKDLKKGVKIV
jgi:hypothetical protein